MAPKILGCSGNPIGTAKLLQVIEIDRGDITAEMEAFDSSRGQVVLPQKGPCMLMIFLKAGGINLFTLIWPSTPEILEETRKEIGEWFGITINENETAV